MTGLRKAAFLDRDGVINLDHGYLHRWEDFEFVPGVVDAMRRLQAAGYALVIVTNQSGIARGFYSEADFERLTQQMLAHLAGEGVVIDAVECCPHLPEGSVAAYARECECRKPAPGMLLRAAARLGLDLPASLMFGDKRSDVEAGRRAGVAHALRLARDAAAEHDADHRTLADALDALGIAR